MKTSISKFAPAFMLILILTGCLSRPKNFSIVYPKTDTGLNRLIDINGCYVCQFGCDSLFYSVFTFYPDGLFRIATTSSIVPELIDCFKQGEHPGYCDYPLWGTYMLSGDTIKTQTIRPEGSGCVIFRDYLIQPGKQIVNISDYVAPEHTNLGYMINYPSFKHNDCQVHATFIPLQSVPDAANCPFYNKKWFNVKERAKIQIRENGLE